MISRSKNKYEIVTNLFFGFLNFLIFLVFVEIFVRVGELNSSMFESQTIKKNVFFFL